MHQRNILIWLVFVRKLALQKCAHPKYERLCPPTDNSSNSMAIYIIQGRNQRTRTHTRMLRQINVSPNTIYVVYTEPFFPLCFRFVQAFQLFFCEQHNKCLVLQIECTISPIARDVHSHTFICTTCAKCFSSRHIAFIPRLGWLSVIFAPRMSDVGCEHSEHI